METVLAGQKALSNSVFVLSEPPLALNVGSSSLTLPKGGFVALPISVSNFDFGDNVTVTISGLAKYEYVTDTLDDTTFGGTSVTLSADEVNSGVQLHSTYGDSGRPVNALTVTAANSTLGETAETPSAQTITVTGAPATTPVDTALALLTQYAAAGFNSQRSSGGYMTTPVSDTLFDQAPLLTKPAN